MLRLTTVRTMSPAGGALAPPAWWPARLYYGWALVGALGVTATVSYGVLSYGFAVFITPMQAELGWSAATITGAFSLGALVMGLVAIPVGAWVDRHGSRGLMTAGSVLATLLLLAWSRVESVAAFYLIWAAMGAAMAAVLYEPAFALVAVWFRRHRGRALTLLTFLGGFASVIFVPLATTLVARYGWRSGLVWLAGIYAPLTILPHALLLRRNPADLGLCPDGDPLGDGDRSLPSPSASTAESALRSRSFRWLAVAFGLSSFTTMAVSVHLIPLLLERGFAPGFAGAAMGLLGLMALPGRLIFTPLGSRWPRARVTAFIFFLAAAAAAVLLWGRSTVAVWLFVGLFGAGFGAITPARAALVAELFGAAQYGRTAGAIALVVSLARAAAPIGASWIYLWAGGPGRGYDALLELLVILCLGAGLAVLMARPGTPARESGLAPREQEAAA